MCPSCEGMSVFPSVVLHAGRTFQQFHRRLDKASFDCTSLRNYQMMVSMFRYRHHELRCTFN